MYDVVIIGAGVSGGFLAYTLARQSQNVLLIDKGKQLHKRSCPLDEGKLCSCDVCGKYYGFAGLGKSEGKFNYTNDFGGDLEQKVGPEEALRLMKEVDNVLCSFGGDEVELYSTVNPALVKNAKVHGLQLLSTEVRHLGTARSTAIFQRIYDVLKSRIDIWFEVDVQRIEKQENEFKIVSNKGDVQARRVVVATGRSGNDWAEEQFSALGVKKGSTRLDLGIRVEMHGRQLNRLLEHTFETKLASQHEGVISYTYCMNPKGRIIRKYQEGLVMPDGQNYREEGSGTANLNFTLFTPAYFNTLQEANTYAQNVIGGLNAGGDQIVVQRLSDLRRQKATSKEDMSGNRIQPTLSATAGNLLNYVPTNYISALEAFLRKLEGLLGESIHEDTLLYGMDGKFYSPVVETDEYFETNVKGLYVIGDSSGVTHSLSQAAASGMYVGEVFNEKIL
ncbi:NAD(P)/FAD-dependent oxidoreductase [Priestia flexa]|uniref:NAD(P)/FAD-dependent oxidoreductase n=1 Tax=Priestia flexa TaxID=86664 RepID=UPI003D2F0991